MILVTNQKRILGYNEHRILMESILQSVSSKKTCANKPTAWQFFVQTLANQQLGSDPNMILMQPTQASTRACLRKANTRR